jgi:hypothetical protein
MTYLFTLLYITGISLGLSGVPDSLRALSPDLSAGNIKVYPNPAADFIRIEWQKGNGMEMHAELYDLFGRRLSRKKAGNSSGYMEIDITLLPRSAYLLKVFSPDGKYSRTIRVVKY